MTPSKSGCRWRPRIAVQSADRDPTTSSGSDAVVFGRRHAAGSAGPRTFDRRRRRVRRAICRLVAPSPAVFSSVDRLRLSSRPGGHRRHVFAQPAGPKEYGRTVAAPGVSAQAGAGRRRHRDVSFSRSSRSDCQSALSPDGQRQQRPVRRRRSTGAEGGSGQYGIAGKRSCRRPRGARLPGAGVLVQAPLLNQDGASNGLLPRSGPAQRSSSAGRRTNKSPRIDVTRLPEAHAAIRMEFARRPLSISGALPPRTAILR